MTIQLAADLVQHFGPCRIAVDGADAPALAAELALLGCLVSSDRPDVALIEFGGNDTPAALSARLAALAPRRGLALAAPGRDRAGIEAALFAAGWRRHPGALPPPHGLGQRSLPPLACYERAGPGQAGLLARGDAAADAAIARWLIVADKVRTGDAVLLHGPTAADGVAILAARSRAGSLQIADTGLIQGARGFDLVAAIDDEPAAIEDLVALLKLDGRLVLGWRDGGPSRWPALADRLGDDMLFESLHHQPGETIAPHPLPLDAAPAGGWTIAIATMNPIGGEAERPHYRHPAFADARTPLVDFGAGYDNPWLYRVMVQLGERLADPATLCRLAEFVAEQARPGSADQGAAIAVLGYRLLEARAAAVAPRLIALIEAFRAAAGDTPHQIRWRVSLAFLAGRLAELAGDRAAAKRWYGRAAGGDWARFAPILATKAIGAAFFAGRLALAEGDAAAARTAFARGVEIALTAAGGDHAAQIGDPARPLGFYLPELAEVIDMGAQCANALAHFDLWRRDPGLFWRQVDVKRFGLATWALDLARENDRLRALIADTPAPRIAA